MSVALASPGSLSNVKKSRETLFDWVTIEFVCLTKSLIALSCRLAWQPPAINTTTIRNSTIPPAAMALRCITV